MNSLLNQIKKRRISLALRQQDMKLRVGMSRQQYQRLEAKGNPRLGTLELIAKGLNSEIMLIPKEKLVAVKAVLAGEDWPVSGSEGRRTKESKESALSDDPWKGILEEEEDEDL